MKEKIKNRREIPACKTTSPAVLFPNNTKEGILAIGIAGIKRTNTDSTYLLLKISFGFSDMLITI
ncbi:MAG: hypothetical protein FWF69_03070 [Firmicutes bacterium]|nr:hypothetical protein [Bacillota bacterium]